MDTESFILLTETDDFFKDTKDDLKECLILLVMIKHGIT